ncbi:non-ribosomal peptide synthetase [Acanthopleuribacter pedis]|uniref:Amino acid adenylation domain-containing protein n=1 Tax=Acanthopleuribacter pedis TaxID=442870 RepID=A0A8J7QJF1_9BACT|nr:non-ribosomal peptide synthetase [Acanthopleuribacter pedis]MBO1319313.1 amino acid adenylation domain-containing protein [Acanthopleuribacter pedis]
MNKAIEQIYRKVAAKELTKAEAMTLLRRIQAGTDPATDPTATPVSSPAAVSPPPVLPKPSGIALSDPASLPTRYPAGPARPVYTLAPLDPVTPAAVQASYSLHYLGDGVWVLRAAAADGLDARAVVATLRAAAEPRVLVQMGAGWAIPTAEIPVPVIAVFNGDVQGAALCRAARCDLVLWSAEGRYHAGSCSAEERAFLAFRFGSTIANLLCGDRAVTGDALQQAGCDGAVFPAADVEHQALQLAHAFKVASPKAANLLKKHLAQTDLFPEPERTGYPLTTAAVATPGAPEKVALAADVVEMAVYPNGVVLVTLCDRDSKNAFSPGIAAGLFEVFDKLRASDAYKVMVLTGYDHLFASGGTRDGLIAIQQGATRYADAPIYHMLLACPVPVIAAMQGHAVGAGLAMGLYCDVQVYAEESVYSSRFMRYGFTPGFGSTLIFPHRFGHDLGRELLFTAADIKGHQLKRRAPFLNVVPRRAVLAQALALAAQMATATRAERVREKAKRAQILLSRLDAVVERELVMHEQTFVGSAETLRRIENEYAAGPAAKVPVPPAPQPAQQAAEALGEDVLETLRSMLAEELCMETDLVDEYMLLTELGLDSITGVTWVRRINAHFDLDIPATRIYDFANLKTFAEAVAAEIPHQPKTAIQADQPASAPETASPPVAVSADPNLSESVRDTLRSMLAEELCMDDDLVEDHALLTDMGLDSITGVTWIRRINAHYALDLSATKIYDHATLVDFAAYVAGEVAGTTPAPAAPTPAPAQAITQPKPAPKAVAAEPKSQVPKQQTTVPKPTVASQPAPSCREPRGQRGVAVVGMAGRFPMAENIDQFWQNIRDGRDCITEIPADRWDWRDYDDGREETRGIRYGGFIEDIALFDPLFFGIAPKEARFMDPQQRLLLLYTQKALDHAGLTAADLQQDRTGVFIAAAPGDYARIAASAAAGPLGLTAMAPSVIPNRISYTFNLKGPSECTETVCASVFTALHHAVQSIERGECEQAIVGGVHLLLSPMQFNSVAAMGYLSPDGRSRPFQKDAAGFARAEGVGVLILRAGEKARDDNSIHAWVRGTGVAHGGRGLSLTAPSETGMKTAMMQAWRAAGVDPREVALIEAHGTATPLGDGIEIEALKAGYREIAGDFEAGATIPPPCRISSLKPIIGHSEIVSGMAALIKVIQAMNHGVLPGLPHLGERHEHVSLEGSPFLIEKDNRPWPNRFDASGKPVPRRAGLNSYGFGGVNAHVLLEAGEQPHPQRDGSEGPFLLVLSAPSQAQLFTLAAKLREHLEHHQVDMTNLCYTLQLGREARDHRLALVADSRADAVTKLAGVADADNRRQQRIYLGDAGPKGADRLPRHIRNMVGPQQIEASFARRDWDALAQLWIGGIALPWAAAYRDRAVRRIPLPGHYFDLARYWVDGPQPAAPAATPTQKTEPVAPVAPTTDLSLETRVTAIIAELVDLDPERIERDRPLHYLGWDSVLTLEMGRRLQEGFGVALGNRELLEQDTVVKLVDLLTRKGAEPVPVPTPSRQQANPGPATEPFPLAEGQLGLWLLQKADPRMTAYNVPITLATRQAVDVPKLREACRLLLVKHPVLQTSFLSSDTGKPRQVHDVDKPLFFEQGVLPAGEPERIALLKTTFKQPFRLDGDPLMRVHLFSAGEHDHVLLVTLHHIIFDGTSMKTFIADLLTTYTALCDGREPQTAPQADGGYADFVAWEQNHLAEQGDQLSAWWRDHLAGPLPVLALNTDRPRTRQRTFEGASLFSHLSQARGDRVRALAKQHGVSTFVAMLAIYKVLLFRHTHQQDIVVGTPTSGRPQPRFEQTIGYFINTIAVRSRLNAAWPFRELLNRLKWQVADALDHASLPFPRLVAALGVKPGAHAPVYQTTFLLQNFFSVKEQDAFAAQFPGWSSVHGVKQEGEDDLSLHVLEGRDGFALSFGYNPELFDAETIERFAEHFNHLVDAVSDDPNQPIGAYAFLGPAEKEKVLVAWNNSREDFGPDLCLHDRFAREVRQRPQQIALERVHDQGSETLTFAALDRRVEALAGFLQSRGIGPEQLVPICFRRSFDMVVAMLGVLRAGGAFVPMDPDHPAERLRFLVEDTDARLVLTSAELVERVAAAGVTTIALDRDQEAIQAAGPAQRGTVTPENLAYVIYTSGSTGKPKGVMIEHRQIRNTLQFLAARYPLAENDAYLLKTNTTFDVSLSELFGWVFGRGRLVILPPGAEKDPQRLIKVLARHAITHLNFAPSALNAFLRAAQNRPDFLATNALKVLMVAGEAFPKDLVAESVAAFPRARVENIYGPTEAAIYGSYFSCSGARIHSANLPIGRPVANTHLIIVDEQMQPVPIGVPGELCLAGKGIARGYLNRPALTREKFVINPFEDDPDYRRLYRTGDLTRRLADGNVEYMGRIDHQVKVRGFRVELGEIETQLDRHALVGESVVVARRETGQLVAYFLPNDRQQVPDAQTLRDHLGAVLPDYMVPAFFVALDEIPLSSSGKVNRKDLAAREIVLDRREPPKPKAKPTATPKTRDQIASTVLDIWRAVLQVQNIAPGDAFFEAGGDSLNAVLLAERIQKVLGCAFTTTDVMHFPTVDDMATVLAKRVGAEEAPAPPEQSEQAAAEPAPPAAAEPAPSVTTTSEPPTRMETPPQPQNQKPALPEDDGVAIIGISCLFPGARNHHEFWTNLRLGSDAGVFHNQNALREKRVPEALINHPNFVPLQMAIEDRDLFDPEFFNLSSRDALLMDPQFRLLLQHSWQAVEDAGYVPDAIRDTAVYMSASTTLYQTMLHNAGEVGMQDRYVSWILAQGGTIPTRISHYLGLTGPSMFVHTNCSSSLTGLHAAFQSIRNGDATYALVGGATVPPVAAPGYMYQPGLNFSGDGRCKTFDEKADGMVGGEGVAVVLLKQARAAVADGDTIYAVLRGIAVNNDGADKAGYYAPSVRGQAAVIDKVLQTTGIDPESVGYIEAHGTGTKLGDPIEVAALGEVYRRTTDKNQFCGLGSVKTNIGHLDTASGLAGCIKVALSLYHGELPPSLHYRNPNPAVDFATSPFYVVDELTPWQRGETPRRAGLSSFGIGGTNVHALFEEPRLRPAEQTTPASDAPYLIVLSARNEERLREAAANLHRFALVPDQCPMADVAYTLQVGRVAMQERLALVVADRREMLLGLEAFLADEPGPWQRGTVGAGSSVFSAEDLAEMQEKWVRTKQWDKLVALWLQGGAVAWSRLTSQRPRRISLPTYPFARERFMAKRPVKKALHQLHPLVHENVSTLHQQAYRSRFDGGEFFLAEHVVRGEKLLPGVAYLEMARAAAVRAYGDLAETDVRLRNIVWLRPFAAASDENPIHIALEPTEQGDGIRFEIRGESETGEPPVHCRGIAEIAPSGPREPLDLAPIRDRCNRHQIDGDRCYATFRAVGVHYGPAFRLIQALHGGDREVLAQLQGDAAAEADFLLEPGMLDAALQACIGLKLKPGGDQAAAEGAPIRFSLPFALQELRVHAPLPDAAYVWIRHAEGSSADDRMRKLDIDLCDGEGRVALAMRGFSTRVVDGGEPLRTPQATEPKQRPLLFSPRWAARALAETTSPFPAGTRHIVLHCDPTHEQEALRNHAEALVMTLRSGRVETRYSDLAVRLFEEIRSLLASRREGYTFVQLLVPTPVAAGLAAVLKSAHAEQPKFIGQLLLLEGDETPEQLAGYLADNGLRPEDTVVRYRDGSREVLDWQEQDRPEAIKPVWVDGGVYLITGGAGGVGLLFAEEIAEQTEQAVLYLMGRSSLSDETRARLARIEELGASVIYRAADVCQAAEVQTLVDAIAAEQGRLDGVLHAAGVLDDGFILKKSAESFRAVLAPKVAGTLLLDKATRALDPGLFVLFSSGVGVLGGPGQADYAAANAFLNAFAEERRTQRPQRTTLSVAWPLWRDGGMQVTEARQRAMEENVGLQPMSLKDGLAAFYAAVAMPSAQVMVLDGVAERIRAFMKPRTLVREETKQPVPAEPATAAPNDVVRAATLAWVRGILADITRDDPAKIRRDTAFEQLGVDSIMQMSVIEALEKTTGELPKTLLFEYPDVGELVDHLLAEYGQSLHQSFGAAREPEPQPDAPGPAEPVADSPAPSAPTALRPFRVQPSATPHEAAPQPKADDGIAIIGISGRFPQSPDLDALWQHLLAGDNCITRADATRRHPSLSTYLGEPEDTTPRYGGFLDDTDRFDHHLFGIPEEQVLNLSPELRLFLETTWLTFEDAGYSRAALHRFQQNHETGVGVFAGIMYHQYAWTIPNPRTALLSANVSEWHIPNRTSHFFNLTGPSMAINSACSSSLSAIHTACDSLRQGNCSMAIAGGVNLTLDPSKYDLLEKSRMLDRGDRSRGFGTGSGYIPGEGVGTVLLKPLAQAVADGDRIHAVIRASFANHGGGRQMYTAPDPKQQTRLITTALQRSGIDPSTIGYVESAANGSDLGDPLEVLALKKAFAAATDRRGFCALGTVKSNLGHLEAASGMSQLAKVLLQLRHQTLVPTINAEPLNPKISFNDSAFYLQQDTRAWHPETDPQTGQTLPRRAMINSFGAGGSYNNLVIEEYQPKPVMLHPAQRARLFLFSAATEAGLAAWLDRFSDFLAIRPEIDAAALAAALAQRDHGHPHRLAVVADTVADLRGKLDLAARGTHHPDAAVFVSGQAAPVTALPAVHEGMDASELHAVAAAFVAGESQDLSPLYRGIPKHGLPMLPATLLDHGQVFRHSAVDPDLDFFLEIAEKITSGELSPEQFDQLVAEMNP